MRDQQNSGRMTKCDRFTVALSPVPANKSDKKVTAVQHSFYRYFLLYGDWRNIQTKKNILFFLTKRIR